MKEYDINKKIETLSKKVVDHLGVEMIPISYDDSILDDSRLCVKPEVKLVINERHKNNYIECAKSIVHEFRHLFQIMYAFNFNDELAIRWRKAFQNTKSSENSDILNNIDDSTEYVYQEIEIDAFAFTKHFLKTYENLDVVHPSDSYENIINQYIKYKKHLM